MRFWLSKTCLKRIENIRYGSTDVQLGNVKPEPDYLQHWQEVVTQDELAERDAAIRQLVCEIKPALGYLNGYSCSDNCDPEVNFHQPECHITAGFDKVLTALAPKLKTWGLE